MSIHHATTWDTMDIAGTVDMVRTVRFLPFVSVHAILCPRKSDTLRRRRRPSAGNQSRCIFRTVFYTHIYNVLLCQTS